MSVNPIVPGPGGQFTYPSPLPAQSNYTNTVRSFYPSASLAQDVISYTNTFISTNFGINATNLMLAQSVCSDDANAPYFGNASNMGQTPPFQNNFLGPFFAGGVGGYPHTGITAFIAWGSHVTNTGALALTAMPHIGITQNGDLGYISRYGHTSENQISSTCGAIAVANAWVISSSNAPTTNNFPNDYQQYTLTDILYPYRAAITTGSFGQQMQFSTEKIRVSSSQWIINNIPNLTSPPAVAGTYPIPANIYYFCGTFINVDYGYDAYINPNTFQVYDISLGASGSWVDYTTQFLNGL